MNDNRQPLPNDAGRADATAHVNPWHERIRERFRAMGGQYRSPATDRLDADLESLIEFEAERARLATVTESTPF